MLWKSKNGKWVIHSVEQEDKTNHLVNAEWLTKSDKVWMRVTEVSGKFGVTASNRPDYDLPMYIQKNGVRLVEESLGKTVVTKPEVKSVDTPEKLDRFALTEHAKKFLKEKFDMDLDIPIVINGRLKSTYGRFQHYRHNRVSVQIDMSKNMIQYHPKEEVIDVLEHELIHYAVYENNTGSEHRDGHPVFEGELRKHGVGSTMTTTPRMPRQTYMCTECEAEFQRSNRLGQVANYRSGCCSAPLKYLGRKVHEKFRK